jgi:polyhydroxyalkanoate synthesis regulator phasin
MFFKKDKSKEVREIKEIMDMPEEETPLPAVERETSAPLFVKVDKYRDIIKTIQELKLFVSSTKQVFAVLQDVENLRSDSINVLRATVQRLERSILEIDSELLRPHGVGITDTKSSEVGHLESSLEELQKQLMDLKRELQGMK